LTTKLEGNLLQEQLLYMPPPKKKKTSFGPLHRRITVSHHGGKRLLLPAPMRSRYSLSVGARACVSKRVGHQVQTLHHAPLFDFFCGSSIARRQQAHPCPQGVAVSRRFEARVPAQPQCVRAVGGPTTKREKGAIGVDFLLKVAF
jgi:hypothetical protein